MILCLCGNQVEPEREYYAIPTCYACLPPPEPLPIVTPTRVLFVGELNPYGTDPRYALYDDPPGSAGHRLRERVLGISRHVYLGNRIERVNLCTGTWSPDRARRSARRICEEQHETSRFRAVVVMLGSKVSSSFAWKLGRTMSGADVEKTIVTNEHGLCTFLAVPHPSCRNRLWNNPAMIPTVRAALREVASSIPWGCADNPTESDNQT